MQRNLCPNVLQLINVHCMQDHSLELYMCNNARSTCTCCDSLFTEDNLFLRIYRQSFAACSPKGHILVPDCAFLMFICLHIMHVLVPRSVFLLFTCLHVMHTWRDRCNNHFVYVPCTRVVVRKAWYLNLDNFIRSTTHHWMMVRFPTGHWKPCHRTWLSVCHRTCVLPSTIDVVRHQERT